MRQASLLVIGCGDIGLRAARLWLDQSPDKSNVTGNVRSAASAAMVRAAGFHPWQYDLDGNQAPQLPAHIEIQKTHILYLTPPAQDKADDAATDRRLENVLAALPAAPQSFTYISTSGVYGDRQGGWVDENTPPAPLTDRAKRRVAAERCLRTWQVSTATRTTILRVPGIYGPGRLPLEKIKQGAPLILPEEALYTNLIHADDLARVCIAAVERGSGIYNVGDGNTVTSTEYYLRVARLAGLPTPAFISLKDAQTIFDPMRLSFINESRRLKLDRLHELQVDLLYADLDAGIRASLNAPI
jgi:nucleoside-diphosphate-sugar epimerase